MIERRSLVRIWRLFGGSLGCEVGNRIGYIRIER